MMITNLFPPHARGGAERVAATVADALVDAGHNVVVVTTQREGESVEEGRYRVYRYRPKNLFWYGDIEGQPLWRRALWRIVDLWGYSLLRPVTRVMFREHPQLVITHNLVGMGYRIPEMLRRFRARHIHTLHDVQLVVPSGQLWYNARPRVIHRLYAWVCRGRFGSPALVVSPSQWLMDFYTSRGFFLRSKKTVLQNPVAITAAREHESTEAQGTLHILYVGQLEEHKGIIFLIETIKKFQMSDVKSQMFLDIVGSGGFDARVRAMVAGDARVILHGALPHEKLAEFYADADVVVVPSLVAENQPTVILEAFANGVPVIASRIGGIPELVEDGVTGELFEPGNGDDFCRALHRMMESKTRATMQRAIAGRAIGVSPKDYVTTLIKAVER